MSNQFAIFLLIIAFSIGCKPYSTDSNTSKNPSKFSVAFRLDEKDLIPEGITYDSKTGSFFLSSINKHKIIEVKKDNTCSNFIESDQDSMAESLGLKVDADKRRLWALSNDADLNYSFVHIYNIDTKKLVKKLRLSTKEKHLLNDMVLSTQGDAYVTDTQGNSIFYVPENLSKIELFLGPDTLLAEVNGITISSDETRLYAASNFEGITIINISSKSITPIENWMNADTRGIDGLVIYKNSLIGIRNGIRGLPAFHVVKYSLNPNGNEIISAELLDHKSDLFEVPTTGVIVNDKFYCLAVTSLVVYLVNRMDEEELLNKPTVLKYNLNFQFKHE